VHSLTLKNTENDHIRIVCGDVLDGLGRCNVVPVVSGSKPATVKQQVWVGVVGRDHGLVGLVYCYTLVGRKREPWLGLARFTLVHNC